MDDADEDGAYEVYEAAPPAAYEEEVVEAYTGEEPVLPSDDYWNGGRGTVSAVFTQYKDVVRNKGPEEVTAAAVDAGSDTDSVGKGRVVVGASADPEYEWVVEDEAWVKWRQLPSRSLTWIASS
ncbi:uncharacterized protein IUM83_12767 [Phytophthora cinnamomi]|uniref:uncharacterized protein n=1 Tax=Phytophthora cinnamomi TaxID=4785 RepID=UPI00355A66FC|nr:hypothetical protein IUM83_12767 [Phytophthora cinnamomi]